MTGNSDPTCEWCLTFFGSMLFVLSSQQHPSLPGFLPVSVTSAECGDPAVLSHTALSFTAGASTLPVFHTSHCSVTRVYSLFCRGGQNSCLSIPFQWCHQSNSKSSRPLCCRQAFPWDQAIAKVWPKVSSFLVCQSSEIMT